jgi:acyl-CoA synthetase (AMP-forming)/AMP-acid ligase II
MRMLLTQFADVERGAPGELWIRGPNIMQGYVEQSGMEETFTNDGFFPTGDVGYVNDQGFVFLVDRLKELIKVKGCVLLLMLNTNADSLSVTRSLQQSWSRCS